MEDTAFASIIAKGLGIGKMVVIIVYGMSKDQDSKQRINILMRQNRQLSFNCIERR